MYNLPWYYCERTQKVPIIRFYRYIEVYFINQILTSKKTNYKKLLEKMTTNAFIFKQQN